MPETYEQCWYHLIDSVKGIACEASGLTAKVRLGVTICRVRLYCIGVLYWAGGKF